MASAPLSADGAAGSPSRSRHQQDFDDELSGIEDTWTLIGHSETDMELSQSSKAHESDYGLRASAALAAGTLPEILNQSDDDDGEEDVTR